MSGASRESDRGARGHVEALRAGTIVGGWEIVREIGHGGFSIVYEARNRGLGSKSALKEFKPRTALRSREDDLTLIPASPEYAEPIAKGLAKFEEEGRRAAELWRKHKSPGVIAVYDLIRANSTAYLAMDLVDGLTLQQSLESRARQGVWPNLEQSWVLGLMSKLFDIAESLHRAGIIHRDIKPHNLMLSDQNGEPSLTIIDFGAARNEYIKFDRSQSSEDAALTHGYAAPEQYSGGEQSYGPQGAWTDIYAIGGVVYWLMLGTAPPSAAVPREPLWPRLRKRYDERLLKSVDKAMSKRPAERWQDIAAWRKEISPLLPAAPGMTDTGRFPWRAVMATLALAGISGTASFWLGRTAPVAIEPAQRPQAGSSVHSQQGGQSTNPQNASQFPQNELEQARAEILALETTNRILDNTIRESGEQSSRIRNELQIQREQYTELQNRILNTRPFIDTRATYRTIEGGCSSDVQEAALSLGVPNPFGESGGGRWNFIMHNSSNRFFIEVRPRGSCVVSVFCTAAPSAEYDNFLVISTSCPGFVRNGQAEAERLTNHFMSHIRYRRR